MMGVRELLSSPTRGASSGDRPDSSSVPEVRAALSEVRKSAWLFLGVLAIFLMAAGAATLVAFEIMDRRLTVRDIRATRDTWSNDILIGYPTTLWFSAVLGILLDGRKGPDQPEVSAVDRVGFVVAMTVIRGLMAVAGLLASLSLVPGAKEAYSVPRSVLAVALVDAMAATYGVLSLPRWSEASLALDTLMERQRALEKFRALLPRRSTFKARAGEALLVLAVTLVVTACCQLVLDGTVSLVTVSALALTVSVPAIPLLNLICEARLDLSTTRYLSMGAIAILGPGPLILLIWQGVQGGSEVLGALSLAAILFAVPPLVVVVRYMGPSGRRLDRSFVERELRRLNERRDALERQARFAEHPRPVSNAVGVNEGA